MSGAASIRPIVIVLVLIGTLIGPWTMFPLAAQDDRGEVTAADDEMANQIARDVFTGEKYWWKRQTDIKSGSWLTGLLSAFYEYIIRPILQFLYELIGWIFKALFSGLGTSGGDWSQGVPFLWTIIAILAALVVWRVITVLRRPAVPANGSVGPEAVNILPRADELLEQAQTALARNDRRTAIRLAFLSLLAWFQDQGQLKYDASRSNREYQNDLRKWPGAIAVFRVAADPFERCWYGGRELEAAQVEAVISRCRSQFQSQKGAA